MLSFDSHLTWRSSLWCSSLDSLGLLDSAAPNIKDFQMAFLVNLSERKITKKKIMDTREKNGFPVRVP